MNNDINNTLQALVPILQMNGENVQSIEAVQDWYTINGTEYMKEVAEITYTSGYRKYADIGCDANLTAVYDVMAVLQEIKPSSKCIGRIVRGVYDFPPVEPELKELSEWKADFKGYINALNIPKDDYDGILEYIDEVPTAEQEAPDINVGNTDAISRTQAIDALKEKVFHNLSDEFYGAMQVLDELPSTQPERKDAVEKAVAVEAISDELMSRFDISATYAYEIAEKAMNRIEAMAKELERGEQDDTD